MGTVTSTHLPCGIFMSMWVIYAHPSDFPNEFVVRRHDAMPGGIRASSVCRAFKTLEEARAELCEGTSSPAEDRSVGRG